MPKQQVNKLRLLATTAATEYSRERAGITWHTALPVKCVLFSTVALTSCLNHQRWVDRAGSPWNLRHRTQRRAPTPAQPGLV